MGGPNESGLRHAFRRDGLLVHVISSHSPFWARVMAAKRLVDLQLEHDCGYNCAAFSLFHQKLPFLAFPKGGVALLFNAERVWSAVQCMSVIDSNSEGRVCSNCGPLTLPSGANPRCMGKCEVGDGGALCRQLQAGCGVQWTMPVEWRKCSAEEVEAGSCEMCRTPQWCDAEHVRSAGEWLRVFGNGTRLQARQCKWRATQAAIFIDAVHSFTQRLREAGVERAQSLLKRSNVKVINNEVNLYLDHAGHEGDENAVLPNALVGASQLLPSCAA